MTPEIKEKYKQLLIDTNRESDLRELESGSELMIIETESEPHSTRLSKLSGILAPPKDRGLDRLALVSSLEFLASAVVFDLIH